MPLILFEVKEGTYFRIYTLTNMYIKTYLLISWLFKLSQNML